MQNMVNTVYYIILYHSFPSVSDEEALPPAVFRSPSEDDSEFLVPLFFLLVIGYLSSDSSVPDDSNRLSNEIL